MPSYRGDQKFLRVFQDLADTAEKKAHDLEPWSQYYKLRAKEMESLFSMHSPPSHERALDIGSGIGFNAFILAKFYDNTVACDLYAEDVRTHSPGIEKAKRFLGAVSCKGVDVISARCEELPFRANYFDSIYMIYTLEHIKDRRAALIGARRVLKPDGDIVVLIPAFLEVLFYPFYFYADFLKRAVSWFAGSWGKGHESRVGSPSSDSRFTIHDSRNEKPFMKRFRSAYPHFPFPEPHGEYPNYFNELIRSVPLIWFKQVKKSGLRIKEAFTTMLFPREFLSLLLGDKALDFYIRTLWINKRFGKNTAFKHLGQNLCLILGKDDV